MVRFFLVLAPAVIPFGFMPSWAEETKPREIGWPQFRGPDGLGLAPEGIKFPVRFGPDANLLWKTLLPSGNSSPCLWGERIFLTAFNNQKQLLEPVCLPR